MWPGSRTYAWLNLVSIVTVFYGFKEGFFHYGADMIMFSDVIVFPFEILVQNMLYKVNSRSPLLN